MVVDVGGGGYYILLCLCVFCLVYLGRYLDSYDSGFFSLNQVEFSILASLFNLRGSFVVPVPLGLGEYLVFMIHHL